MNDTIHSHLICCFCDENLDLDATFCGFCNEYKGIMTVEAFEAYLHTTVECDCVT